MSIKVLDPRINLHEYDQALNLVQKGCSRYTYQTEGAKSYSNTQALFSIIPPSTRTIIDRNIRVRWYFEVKTDQDQVFGVHDALRQCPVSSIIDSITVNINGDGFSHQTSDTIHAMMCYGVKNDDHNHKISQFPSQPDAYQEYSQWAQYGSGKCPLKQYGENSTIPTRAGFYREQVDSKTSRFIVTEPLWLSPFNNLNEDAEGFVNVNKLDFSIRFKSDLSRVLSHDSGNNAPNISSVTVNFYQQPEMLMLYITPPLLMPLPSILSLPYYKPDIYIKSVGNVNAGASKLAFSSDTFRLSQIPRYAMVFAQQSRNARDFKTSDSFAVINRVSVLWNNENNLLSSATQQDLYNMSVRNGCTLSYPAWSNYRGSPLVMSFGNDLALGEDESVGVHGQYTFKIEVDLKNSSINAKDYELYVIFMNEGVYQIFENGARSSLGNLTREMVLSAHQAPEQLNQHEYAQLQGSGFWSGLKGFFNKVAHGVSDVAKFVSPIVSTVAPEFAPLVAGVSGVADAVKQGTGGRLSGGRRLRRR